MQRFLVGYLLQAGIKCLSSIGLILRKPQYLIKILKSPVNRELGLFFGSYVLIFRVILILFSKFKANESIIL
jgi:hypothetical protein